MYWLHYVAAPPYSIWASEADLKKLTQLGGGNVTASVVPDNASPRPPERSEDNSNLAKNPERSSGKESDIKYYNIAWLLASRDVLKEEGWRAVPSYAKEELESCHKTVSRAARHSVTHIKSGWDTMNAKERAEIGCCLFATCYGTGFLPDPSYVVPYLLGFFTCCALSEEETRKSIREAAEHKAPSIMAMLGDKTKKE